MSEQLFPLGWVVTTPGALEAFEKSGEDPNPYIRRHASGDWGELDPHDKAVNQCALDRQDRIFSSYRLKDGTKIYIISEYDRSSTTILLPDEY